MAQGGVWSQLLAEGTGHEQIAGVGDEGHDGNLPIACANSRQGENSVFSCGRIVGEAFNHGLERRETGVFRRKAQGERYRKVTEGDGHSVPQPPLKTGPVAVYGNRLHRLSFVLRI